jgi:hypothetical protein
MKAGMSAAMMVDMTVLKTADTKDFALVMKMVLHWAAEMVAEWVAQMGSVRENQMAEQREKYLACRTVDMLDTDLVSWLVLVSVAMLVDSRVLKMVAKTEIQKEYL